MSVIGLVGESYAGVGDGPRAYQLVPTDSNIVNVIGIAMDGNQAFNPGVVSRDSQIDVNVAALQYTRAFDFNGTLAAAFVVASYGSIDGVAAFGDPVFASIQGDSSGLFDLQLGFVLGLKGSPAMAPKEYVAHKPGLQIGLLGKAFLPSGKYDENNALNPGANRWGLQIGLPTTYAIGSSLVSEDLTTFEIIPSVTFFTDNDDTFGDATSTEQSLLFMVEMHLTRNFSRTSWVSLDAIYTYGGETTTDSIDNNDIQKSFALGATLNFYITPNIAIKPSYGKTIYNNKDGAEGDMFRLMTTINF